jgi:hypothetical protein
MGLVVVLISSILCHFQPSMGELESLMARAEAFKAKTQGTETLSQQQVPRKTQVRKDQNREL